MSMFGRFVPEFPPTLLAAQLSPRRVLSQINEAFASQFAYCVEQLDIPVEKINIKFVCYPDRACAFF